MKKLFCILLAIATILTLTSCTAFVKAKHILDVYLYDGADYDEDDDDDDDDRDEDRDDDREEVTKAPSFKGDREETKKPSHDHNEETRSPAHKDETAVAETIPSCESTAPSETTIPEISERFPVVTGDFPIVTGEFPVESVIRP